LIELQKWIWKEKINWVTNFTLRATTKATIVKIIISYKLQLAYQLLKKNSSCLSKELEIVFKKCFFKGLI
jgi:hypothetical protein